MGTYAIGFKDDPQKTFMADQDANTVVGLTTTPGKISIAAGACCRTDGECLDWTQGSCTADGGTYFDGQLCAAPTPCCMNDATCQMLDTRCCMLLGGVPMPDAPACDDDADGDGLDAGCGDACPGNPEKVALGPCGCENSELLDSDVDGVDDCADQCPGLDDALYAPGCGTAIPAASTWGIAVLILTLLAGAKVRTVRPSAERQARPA